MKNNEKWLNEKTTITLKRSEMFSLANVFSDASRNDFDFTKCRDRKIRKIFKESIEKRHKLWLKIIHTAEG